MVGQLLTAKLVERVEGLEPQSLAYRLRIVDATTASIPDSKGTDYRIHLGFDLGSLQIDQIDSRLTMKAGDLILADRGYSQRGGLEAVREEGEPS